MTASLNWIFKCLRNYITNNHDLNTKWEVSPSSFPLPLLLPGRRREAIVAWENPCFPVAGKGLLEEFQLRAGSAGVQGWAGSLYRKAVFLFPLSGNCDSLISMALLYDKRLPSRLLEEVLLGRMLKLSWGENGSGNKGGINPFVTSRSRGVLPTYDHRLPKSVTGEELLRCWQKHILLEWETQRIHHC